MPANMPEVGDRIVSKGLINLLRLIGAAAYYFALALLLGPSAFGVFAAALAVLAVLNPIFDMGASTLVTSDLVQGREPQDVLQENVGAWVYATITGQIVAVPIVMFVASPMEIGIAVAICLGSIIQLRPLAVAVSTFNVGSSIKRYLWFEAFVLFLRGSAIVLMASQPMSLRFASIVHAALGLAIALSAWRAVRAEVSSAILRPMRAIRTILRGSRFALGLASQAAIAEMDKVGLSIASSDEEVGTYSFAARLMTLATMPIHSLLAARYPENFMSDGFQRMRRARAFLRRGVGLGVVITLFIWTAAGPLLVYVAPTYSGSFTSLRILAIIPVLHAFSFIGGDILTGAGRQNARSLVQLLAAMSCLSLSLYLTPHMGQSGAAIARVTSEALLAVLIWALVALRPNLVRS